MLLRVAYPPRQKFSNRGCQAIAARDVIVVAADLFIMRPMALAVALVTAGLWSSIAGAQQEPDVAALQLKACTLIKDDAARIRCYDHAMSRPASESPFVTIPQSSGSGSAAPLVTIPQSSIAATSEAPPVATPQSPITGKSETSKFFDRIIGNIAPSAATPEAPLVVMPQSSTAATSEAPPVATPQSPVTPKSGTFFDKIIGSITPSSGATGANWDVKADKLSLEDASQLLGTLASADGKATLVLKCNAKSTEAYVTTSSFLGWESLRVLYRINDNPVTERRWAASAAGSGAVSNNAIEFINGLTDNGTLLVSVFDYNGTNHDLRFNLGPVSGLRSQIATVCRWPAASFTGTAVLNEPTVNPQSSKPKAGVPRGPNAPLELIR